MTDGPENSAASTGPSLMVKATYLWLVLVALLSALNIGVQVLDPAPAMANRVIAGLGFLSVALALWPWPKSRIGAWHLTRIVSSVSLGTALFVFPIQIDYGDEQSRAVNTGLFGMAVILHGLVILIVSEALRRAAENDQRELVATCRKIAQRVTRLECELEDRDQAVIAEVQAMAAAVERLEHAGGRRRWFGRRQARGG